MLRLGQNRDAGRDFLQQLVRARYEPTFDSKLINNTPVIID